MASTTSRRSFGGHFVGSMSPTRRFSSSPSNSSSINSTFPSPSFRFNLDYQASRSILRSADKGHVMCKKKGGPSQRIHNCMCSPTNHPGSFRCSMHKGNKNMHKGNKNVIKTTLYCPNKIRRSAMANSLVRLGGVEGVDMGKRSLACHIRLSLHHQLRRRQNFQRRPSRLSIYMSKTLNSDEF